MRRLACVVFTLGLACADEVESEATDLALGEYALVSPSALFGSYGCESKNVFGQVNQSARWRLVILGEGDDAALCERLASLEPQLGRPADGGVFTNFTGEGAYLSLFMRNNADGYYFILDDETSYADAEFVAPGAGFRRHAEEGMIEVATTSPEHDKTKTLLAGSYSLTLTTGEPLAGTFTAVPCEALGKALYRATYNHPACRP